jgi:hypothetical protein
MNHAPQFVETREGHLAVDDDINFPLLYNSNGQIVEWGILKITPQILQLFVSAFPHPGFIGVLFCLGGTRKTTITLKRAD